MAYLLLMILASALMVLAIIATIGISMLLIGSFYIAFERMRKGWKS